MNNNPLLTNIEGGHIITPDPLDSVPALIVPQDWLSHILFYRRGKSRPDTLSCLVLAWLVADPRTDPDVIAKMLGSTPESVSESLNRLAGYGLIAIKDAEDGFIITPVETQISMITKPRRSWEPPFTALAGVRARFTKIVSISSTLLPFSEVEVSPTSNSSVTKSVKESPVREENRLVTRSLDRLSRERVSENAYSISEPPLGVCIKDAESLRGQRGAENIYITELLFMMFSGSLRGHETKISRVAQIRTSLEKLGDGAVEGFVVALFHCRSLDGFRPSGSRAYLDALPVRVLNYLTATVKQKLLQVGGKRSVEEMFS